MDKTSLIKSVQLAGGQVALAAKVRARIPGSKVAQAYVWAWLHSNKSPMPPAEYVLAICDSVEWQVTPHELRPDIYPNPLDAMPQGAARRLEEAA